MDQKDIESIKKAGKIAKQVVAYARKIVKKDMLLVDIANKIEEKIIELGGKLGFPVNLAINEIAAHYTPSYNDETKAEGLLKIDIGVEVGGFVADTAFSIDLENDEENKKLIKSSDEALSEAIKAVKGGKSFGEIGKAIQEVINDAGFSPIKNLSGHEIGSYDLHAGLTIPNYDNGNQDVLGDGLYAIEPFSTNGQGIVYDGKPSGIYSLKEPKNVRDSKAREMLDFIIEEYKSLPFCSRWLVAKFGTRALLSLRLLEQAGILHRYPTLVEKNKGKVSQSEHTILIERGEVEVITH